jgi:phosphoribosylamine--glycine ligase
MTMKILVVGGGGREHAIAQALTHNRDVELFSVMSRRNPAIERLSQRILIERETNVDRVAGFARSHCIDYAVIGPEAPLGAGITDSLEACGIPCLGPTVLAARLETDKAFCRSMMDRHGIAGCPLYRVFHSAKDAADFIDEYEGEMAIKPIGLTGGKGVRITGEHLDRAGAREYVKQLGGEVVIEERLEGEEFTLQAFSDGDHLVPMPLVQDHKRAYEGDMGPNTGGMGSYSMPDHSLPFVSRADIRAAFSIMEDAVKVMNKVGNPYRGILYGQFMNTRNGPMVIEFNVRFGDPEAMNVLSILTSDFAGLVQTITEGSLSSSDVSFSADATVCKYVVPEGYPENPAVGVPIALGDEGEARVYYANVDERDGTLYTQTSRTLAFVGVASTIGEAERIAERGASSVSGAVRHRKDIGTRELLDRRIEHMRRIR